MIPLYISPTSNGNQCTSDDWKTVASSAMANRTIAIVNPNNGPSTDGPATTAAFVTCINYLRASGVKVVGYVHTKLGFPNIYGYRQFTEVVTDINTWKSTFTVDGIFVDEVSNQYPDPSYDSS